MSPHDGGEAVNRLLIVRPAWMKPKVGALRGYRRRQVEGVGRLVVGGPVLRLGLKADTKANGITNLTLGQSLRTFWPSKLI